MLITRDWGCLFFLEGITSSQLLLVIVFFKVYLLNWAPLVAQRTESYELLAIMCMSGAKREPRWEATSSTTCRACAMARTGSALALGRRASSLAWGPPRPNKGGNQVSEVFLCNNGWGGGGRR